MYKILMENGGIICSLETAEEVCLALYQGVKEKKWSLHRLEIQEFLKDSPEEPPSLDATYWLLCHICSLQLQITELRTSLGSQTDWILSLCEKISILEKQNE